MPRSLRTALAVILLVLAGQRRAAAAITLDANFDSGSLKSYTVAGDTVRLVGRDSYAGSGNNLGEGHWRWLYFKASGVQGLTPTFSIEGPFASDATPGPHELSQHEMVYSYDGANWSFFPGANNTLLNTGDSNPANDLFTFRASAPFTQNDVYVAYALPYPYSRTVAHTQAVLDSPWAAPTASASAGGVIGQSPAGVDDLGRSIPALDLFAYRITNPATDGAAPKRKAMIVAGQHAAETLGLYTFEGLVDWLASDDPRAAALRDKAEVFCYPTLNASGRFAGLTRAMLQWPNTDSNGYWHPGPSGNDYNSPQRTEQQLNAEAMRADNASTPAGLDLFVDFHSSVPDWEITGPNGWGPDGRDDWGYITNNAASLNNPWWLAFRALQPNILQVNSGTGPTSRTSTGFALNTSYGLGAAMSVTFENQFAISRPVAYYHELGKNAGLAMYQAWIRTSNPQPGDFDEDGDVDGGDLAAWTLGHGQPRPAAHYHGDANGDGDVNGADYLIWQRQYAVGTSTAVPEPRAAALAGLPLLALLASRYARRRSLCAA
ncbi:MAG: hypothetical protein DCC67_18935 [Planctomycetota bacterium]|nr:MAG: hypothetical protein DCC67_18935 [Planctomycetota bacterium]